MHAVTSIGDESLVCPECGRPFRFAMHLGSHLTRTHGYESTPKAEKKRAYREANRDEIAEKQRAYREANRDEIAEKKRAYREAMAGRVPAMLTEAEDYADWVEAELAADAAMSGTTVQLERADRLLASREVLRRGGRSAALQRLGWSGSMVSVLLRWWDQTRMAS
jgi:uncharacterized C2H2 Zn-finger protein